VIVEVDGQRFDVPDDATHAEIDAASKPSPKAPAMSTGEAVRTGIDQGASLGWHDELSGISRVLQNIPADWLYEKLHPGEPKAPSAGEQYRAGRDEARANAKEAEAQHPTAYGLSYAAGSAVPFAATGGAAGATLPALASSAALGAAQGAGESEADLGTRRFLADSSLGGALGVAGYGAGAALGAVGSRLSKLATGRASGAAARAAQQAAEESSAAVRSVEGAARERAANAYRQVERIQNLLRDSSLPADTRTALEGFTRSPEYAQLLEANARGALAVAPEAAAERIAAQTAAEEARAALPQAITDRTADLRKTQFGKDAVSLVKSYGEPIVGGIAGSILGDEFDSPKLGGAVGTTVGAIFGRTRAGKAIRYRLERPGNSEALWTMMSKGAAGIAGLGPYTDVLRRAAARGADALAASQYVLWTSDPAFREAVGGAGTEEEPKP
jgi:hypothetical protein